MNSHYEKFLATGVVKCIDSEIPFDIPSGWEWVRLTDLATYIHRGKSPKYSLIRKYPVVAQKCNQWDGFSIEKALFIDPQSITSYSNEHILQDEDLLWNSTGLGTLGRMAIYYTKLNPYELAVADSHVTVIRLLKTMIVPCFLYLYFSSPTIQNVIEDKADGSTKQKELSTNTVCNYLIPLPPLNEQKRIVDRYEQLFPHINKYSKTQVALDELNTDIYIQLRKSILQEAIQGKLVPQDPTEGTAEELLQQIKAEKVKLVKEGKLKKQALADSTIYKGADNRYYEQIGKGTVPIETDYDFPDNWQIARLSSVCALIDGERQAGKHICIDAKYLRGKSAGDYVSEGRFVHKDAQIILVDGENSGEVFTVPCDGYMGSTFKQLWVSEKMSLQYVLHFISFYKDLLRNSKKGAAIPHLNKEIFYTLVIGIPPKQEQERIADRIEQLLQLLK